MTDEEVLKSAGFQASAKFGGCMCLGDYYVFLPRDTRSGKFELCHEVVGKSRTDFPPTTARGVVRQMKLWDATLRDRASGRG